MNSDYDYEPLDDRTQMFREIDQYTASSRRVPESPLIARPLTLSERTGPMELPRKWKRGRTRSVPGGGKRTACAGAAYFGQRARHR